MIKQCYYFAGLLLTIAFITVGFTAKESEKDRWFYVGDDEEIIYTVPTETECQSVNFQLPYTGKSYVAFKQAMAIRESQGQYKLINPFGYMGKYQFGMSALRSIGVSSKKDFLNNPRLQENAFKALLSINKAQLAYEIEKYDGKIINGVKITESGILAAAHLGGAGSVKSYLRSNGRKKFRDGFGTSMSSYLKKFEGYDTSHIIANANAKVRKH
ncbi:peptidoglycan-binding protein LysM [Flavobacterium sp. NST-5]|uniref:Peptidoglycan-binding protein LysM n=1 Tax=Flavobacterium ichthyis TaxID=2698827 RepID=A0ABW9Z6G5_9FLAO|nr:peptidoglycan-binding protein LysM [Flavobacterium ichthyis]NBL64448.1 peptidoglycan-binding protein LysM [Flavobacterium ichthyis]